MWPSGVLRGGSIRLVVLLHLSLSVAVPSGESRSIALFQGRLHLVSPPPSLSFRGGSIRWVPLHLSLSGAVHQVSPAPSLSLFHPWKCWRFHLISLLIPDRFPKHLVFSFDNVLYTEVVWCPNVYVNKQTKGIHYLCLRRPPVNDAWDFKNVNCKSCHCDRLNMLWRLWSRALPRSVSRAARTPSSWPSRGPAQSCQVNIF